MAIKPKVRQVLRPQGGLFFYAINHFFRKRESTPIIKLATEMQSITMS
jgi:hypothetical protein